MARPQPEDGSSEPTPRGIIWIMCDQLPLSQVGFGGGTQASTPNLDRLASQSLQFTNAHVANPTCMPNRATIATGRWPSAHGTRTNGISLDPQAATFMRTLRDQGWSTGAAGKLHFQAMGWPFEPSEIRDINSHDPLALDPDAAHSRTFDGPNDGYANEDLALHRAGHHGLPDDYYGFGRVDLVVGHGDGPTAHYDRWATRQGYQLGSKSGYNNAAKRSDNWNEVWQTSVPLEVHPNTFITESAISQLRDGAKSDLPFLVMASYPDPHHPFCPPDPYFSRHDPSEVELPKTFRSEHSGQLPHIDFLRARAGQPSGSSACWAPDEPQMREILAAHLGQLAFLDDCVGRILGEIDELGLSDDVTVMFTSDHGEMMGEHGLMLKQTIHYPAVTRVPILIRSPGLAPGKDEALVSSADLAPTVLDLAGAKHFRGIQGRSLLDPAISGHSALLIEEEHLFGVDGLPAPIKMRTLVAEGNRLTIYPGTGLGELYSFDDDPSQCHNRFDDPALSSDRAGLYEQMVEALVAVSDRGQAPTAAA